ncbi:N-acetyltransferase family protein [Vineibacter terrae]|uniref:N-acetyltransferase family protein n=1 Tax=Vineibacter terrae TaxID=2586908 RepID=A0A5C8PLF7_9HYPH|nr:GNAT family N-acetyltransferase [Vineibacter terrae]TXL74258.1 N-acetyltransferase family protein [Vineibacter terrae]
MPLPLLIRDSRDTDIPIITGIYGHHVRHGLASFEEEAPSLGEMGRRRADMLDKGYPYIVAERHGRVVGYAYAAAYRLRPAYRFAVENSIYIDQADRGGGIGSALLPALIERCAARGYRQMIAVIGDSANAASIALHAKFGFRTVGTFTSIGWKHGRWVDSVLMQRALGDGDASAPPERPDR